MNKDRLRHSLEVWTNVAVLIMCVLFLSSLGLNWFYRNRTTREVVHGLEKGQQVAAINAVNYKNSPQTLLIALNTECERCTASLPFYNRVAQQAGKTQIVVIFPNFKERVQDYAKQQNLKLDLKDSIDYAKLHVPATPTLILLDQESRVIDFWVGEIPREEQERVLESVAAFQ